MMILIGKVERDKVESEEFKEIDYRRMLGKMEKWVVKIEDEERIKEMVRKELNREVKGSKGKVVVELKEEMMK